MAWKGASRDALEHKLLMSYLRAVQGRGSNTQHDLIQNVSWGCGGVFPEGITQTAQKCLGATRLGWPDTELELSLARDPKKYFLCTKNLQPYN